jgi:hypothetical protein
MKQDFASVSDAMVLGRTIILRVDFDRAAAFPRCSRVLSSTQSVYQVLLSGFLTTTLGRHRSAGRRVGIYLTVCN